MADLGVLLWAASSALALAIVYMTAWWIVSVVARRTDVADIGWGLGVAVIGWACWLWVAPGRSVGRLLVAAVLVTIWGVRLATHIAARGFRRGRREDAHYAAMRERRPGSWWVRSLYTVFWLQGLLMWIVALPLVVMASGAAPPLQWSDAVAVGLWIAGLALESTADRQLARWLAVPENRGKPLASGVWAWSRHPNYVGDALMWWGIGLFALPSPFGLLGLFGPLMVTLLLRFVSGVPPLEKGHRGEPDWEAYRARTPVFLPRPPRRAA